MNGKDPSIPGRYGFRRRAEQRDAALDIVWQRTDAVISAAVGERSALPPLELDWASLPPGLDPADGELDQERAKRKQDQVTSLLAHALDMLADRAAASVVEFGAGSGHLGLLLAHLRPEVRVCLVEIKEYSAERARQRIAALGAENCRVFCGSLDAFSATGEAFDMAMGLHTCGLLADAVLSLAIGRGSMVCLVPCCYGQVASTKEDHDRGQVTKARMHPCSNAFREALGEDGREAFVWCAKAADFSPGRGGAFDAESKAFQTALRCMQAVDADRLCAACESGYAGHLGVLSPLNCSPKCSVLCLHPPQRPVVSVD